MTLRKSLAVLIAASLASITLPGCQRSRPRNVILVCIDTVRYDTWSLPERSGQRDAMSEWNDRAIRFERMQSAAPWTIPSVATVLTGMYPMRHGAGRFQSAVADVNSMRPSVLADDVLTLPEKLSAAGWSTAAILAPSWVNPETGLLQGVSEIRNVPLIDGHRRRAGVAPQRSSAEEFVSLSPLHGSARRSKRRSQGDHGRFVLRG